MNVQLMFKKEEDQMRKSIAWILVCLFVAVLLGACGKQDTADPTVNSTYSISGTITANGSGLEGVTVSLCTSATVTTDANGNYSFLGMSNGSYIVTPLKSGYTFSPISKSVTVNNGNVTGQDFPGSLSIVTYNISGTITANSSGLEGVTVALSTSSTITTTTTDTAGNYSFAGVTNGTYKVTPSKSGFSFSPTTSPVAVNSGDTFGQDFTGTTKSYNFEKLAGPTIWTSLRRAIAVDSLDQVYVTSGSTIFRVNGSGPIIYLSAADIAAAIGGGANASSLDIPSIDMGPDDKLYILEKTYRKILVSDGLGSVAVHRNLSDISGFPALIGVIDYDNILLMNLYDGLWFVKGSGNSLLYDDTLVLGGTSCATQDIAVQFDGYFAYLPGCNGSPMVGGYSDGSGVGILMTTSANVGLGGAWYNFSAIGRNSTGGYVVNIGGKRIAHVATTGQYEMISTQPELDALATAMGEGTFGFLYGVIAEGPTGNIFVASSTAVYVAR